MILERFPAAWKTDITVTRGGRDPKGNPLPDVTHVVNGCMVGWRATTDPVDRSDLTADDAIIYAPVGADFRSGDRLSIPAGPWPSGQWRVAGSAKPWVLGTEVPINRG